ncbi:MAG TPA: hypothetical protein VII11_00210, partial [Bacteroidota bacterium]
MKPAITFSQVAAFRLERHHLFHQNSADLTVLCRDSCGIQAQLVSAARTALWSRKHSVTQSQIDAALL